MAWSATHAYGQVITGTQDAWKSTAVGAWLTAGNWSVGAAPGSTHTAIFDSSSAAVSPTLGNTAYNLRGIVWKSGAGAYTLSLGSGGTAAFTIGADGLQNYSANTQTISSNRVTLTLGTSTFFDVGSTGNLVISSTGTFTLGANALTLKGSSTGTGTISSVISGSGSIIKDGSGTWTLSGVNTYTGTTTVNGGTLKSGVSSALPNTAMTVSGSGAGTTATLDLNGFSDTIASLTLGGSTTTSGASVVTGAGTLTLGGNVTYDATNNPLGATMSGNLALGATRTFTIGDSTSTAAELTLSAVISGTNFGITKAGAGTLSLSGTNTFSGQLTVQTGTLSIATINNVSTAGPLGNSALAVILGSSGSGTGTLEYSGVTASSTKTFSLALGGTGAFQIDSSSTVLTLSGVVSGSGGLQKTGPGTLTLSGPNTYVGNTTINAGTLKVSSDGNLGGLSSGINLNAGTLEIVTGFTTARIITVGDTASTFQVDAGQTFTVSTAIAGPGILNKTGSGIMVLSAVNSFNGGTNVVAGTLRLGAVDRLLTSAGLTISGGTFDLQTFGQTTGAVTLASGSITGTGTGILTGTAFTLQSGTVSAVLAGPGTVTKNTTGSVTLSGSNTFTGSTTISAGTLQVNSNNALGSAASGTTIANGAVLKLNNVNYTTAEPVTLNGSGISNGGALLNSGTSTFAGPINAATNATINAGGGTLNLTGGISKNGTTLTIAGGGTVNITSFGIGGASPNSDLVVDGVTVNENVANSYNGPTYIRNGGVLNANVAGALPTSNGRSVVAIDDSGTGNSQLVLGAPQAVASLTGASSSLINLNGNILTVGSSSGSTTFAGVISGTGGLVKDGTSTQTISGANTYSGSTTVDGGTLSVANSSGNALGSTSNVTVNSGGTFLLGNSNQVNDTATMTLAGGTFAKGNFAEGTASSPGLGALTLTASGSHVDFGAGTVGVLTFASFTPGSFTLTIDNWTGTGNTAGGASTDRLIFASNQSANLSSFSFTGYAPGAVQFDLLNGYWEVTPVTAVPETSTWITAALALGVAAFQVVRRRRGQRLSA